MKINKNLPHIRTFTGTDIALRRQLDRLKIVVIVIAVLSLLSIGGCGRVDAGNKYPEYHRYITPEGCKVDTWLGPGNYRFAASPNCNLAAT